MQDSNVSYSYSVDAELTWNASFDASRRSGFGCAGGLRLNYFLKNLPILNFLNDDSSMLRLPLVRGAQGRRAVRFLPLKARIRE